MTLTQSLSVIMHNETIDLPKASDVLTTLVVTLSTLRIDANDHFYEIFSNAKQMAEKLNILW